MKRLSWRLWQQFTQATSAPGDRARADLVLRGERLLLRTLTESDVAPLAAVLADPEITPWWGTYDEERVRADMAGDDSYMLAVELEGELIGVVQVTEETDPDDPSAALDIAIRSDQHARGVGREALRVVIDHLIRERGHHRFTIDPATGNERAIRSYAALGFRPVGVMRRAERAPDGSWRDALLMDLLADELRRD
jgi:aminoglycoside 6'-N-acetyltransferase